MGIFQNYQNSSKHKPTPKRYKKVIHCSCRQPSIIAIYIYFPATRGLISAGGRAEFTERSTTLARRGAMNRWTLRWLEHGEAQTREAVGFQLKGGNPRGIQQLVCNNWFEFINYGENWEWMMGGCEFYSHGFGNHFPLVSEQGRWWK